MLFRQRGDDTALGGAVELGHDQAGEAERFVECLDLGQRVLADVGVEHQQDFMRRAGVGLLNHAFDLADLVHQVQLRRQAAGGIGQHDVDAARPGGMDGVEDHRRRIAALRGNDLDIVALAPFGQLLARGGAERVARRQQHALALGLKTAGQFADGGGLAGAVDAGQHDDEGLRGIDVEGFFQRRQKFDQFAFQRRLELFGLGQLVFLDPRAQPVGQVLGGLDADIGGQQHRFQLFEQGLVDLGADAEQAGDLPGERATRA